MKYLYVYKYLASNYAQAAAQSGEVYINTLHNLQKLEREEIGDTTEGTLSSYFGGNTIDPGDPSTQGLQLSRVFSQGKLIFKDKQTIMGSFTESTDNCYLFCMTLVKDQEVAKRMGYNACLLIRDPVALISEITSCLRKQRLAVNDPIYGEVTYQARSLDFENQSGVLPVFIKEPYFTYQKEFRIAWSIGDSSIESIQVRCPEIVRLVQKIKF